MSTETGTGPKHLLSLHATEEEDFDFLFCIYLYLVFHILYLFLYFVFQFRIFLLNVALYVSYPNFIQGPSVCWDAILV